MDYDLDELDNSIFWKLHSDPFRSYNKIGENLEISPTTVQDRIQNMIRKGVIRGNNITIDPILGERKQSEVLAEYNPTSLNMVRQHVFFKKINSNETVNKLEKFCDEHPYTHYRANLFGDSLILYAQFDVPDKIVKDMKEVYRHLTDKLGIPTFELVNTKVTVHSKPDFSYLNNHPYRRYDRIDDDTYPTVFHKTWKEFNSDDTRQPLIMENNRVKISNLDMQLLRELTINGKASVTHLAEIYNRNKSVISRHLKKLKEKVISRGILRYNPEAFGLNHIQIIKGKFKQDIEFNVSSVMNYIKNLTLQVEASISSDGENFVLYTNTSPRLASDLTSFFWEITNPDYFQAMQLNLKTSYGYYFYHKNYDEIAGWKTDSDYIQKDPMNIL